MAFSAKQKKENSVKLKVLEGKLLDFKVAITEYFKQKQSLAGPSLDFQTAFENASTELSHQPMVSNDNQLNENNSELVEDSELGVLRVFKSSNPRVCQETQHRKALLVNAKALKVQITSDCQLLRDSALKHVFSNEVFNWIICTVTSMNRILTGAEEGLNESKLSLLKELDTQIEKLRVANLLLNETPRSQTGKPRGRPRKYDPDKDACLSNEWLSGEYPSIADCAKANGVKQRELKNALKRHAANVNRKSR